MKTLILGGARSGKSRYAQLQAEATQKELIYLATASPGDSEMKKRIEAHQANRGDGWQTIETPVDLARTLLDLDRPNCTILVDCLTLWISNCLLLDVYDAQNMLLMDALPCLQANVIMVSNEVGSGIVPCSLMILKRSSSSMAMPSGS